jgi:hypothetical protein
MKAFVCIVEDYEGNKTPNRVFAENDIEARDKLIKMFPKCYVSKAVRFKDYVANMKDKIQSINMFTEN